MTRRLITAALPYANGPIHIGHLVEYVQADIQARFMRSMGHEVLYVCADDTHGTPIEISAMKQGITPDELVARTWEQHHADFRAFGMSFDVYYTTNSPENRALAGHIYEALKQRGVITRRATEQMYSESLGRFLNDRMIKGTCPFCGAADQYGDVCESCGKTYKPTDLLNPYDAITGETPVLRTTENIYVRLTDFVDLLRAWSADAIPQDGVRNFIETWFTTGLEDWCISRDAPYFGFEIPGEPGKFFYVWLDAPVGYIASTSRWCQDNGQTWEQWWGPDADTHITHVIGKDIVYFHTLFWPAMLHAAGLKMPDHIQVHGMLTLNNEKMSKSRGTLIKARTWLDHLDPEYLRFYYAAKLGDDITDFDLNLNDFHMKVNAELINNLVNLTNRVLKFLESRFAGDPGPLDVDHPLVATVQESVARIQAEYAAWNYRAAVRAITELGSVINTFFQDQAPWALIKDDPEAAHRVCALALHGATAIMAALAPITPELVARFSQCVGVERIGWQHAGTAWRPASVHAQLRLLDRIDPQHVQNILEQSMSEATPTPPATPPHAIEADDFKPEVTYDDFAKLDLRVGVVEEVERVPKADKLLRLTVHCGKRINIFAGVAKAYEDPAVLLGKRVLVLANLQPRKMRFGLSEGMLLAVAGPNDEGLELVNLPPTALGGWSVS